MALSTVEFKVLLEIRSLLWSLERRVEDIEKTVNTTADKMRTLELRQSLASTTKQHATLPPKGSKRIT